MNTVKESLHIVIDGFNDDEFLKSIYEILIEKDKQQPGKIWMNLTQIQQMEVMQSANEISNPKKQIDHNDMIKKNQQWLGK